MCALILSASCVTAASVILKHYDGKQNPKMKVGLTLNALASIIATTAKVSLLFTISNAIGQLKWVWFINSRSLLDAGVYDEASRGPFGSLTMLWTKTRKSIASIGAILTILAVAYDPFVQQIVSFESGFQLQMEPDEKVLMNIARYFRLSDYYADLAESRLRAINTAYWNDGFQWTPSCASRNCTWPKFETLA